MGTVLSGMVAVRMVGDPLGGELAEAGEVLALMVRRR